MFASPLQYATMATWAHPAKTPSQLNQIPSHMPAQVSSSMPDHFSHHHAYSQASASSGGLYMLSQAPSLGQSQNPHLHSSLPMFHPQNVGGSMDAMMQFRSCGGSQFPHNFAPQFFGDPRLGPSAAFPTFPHGPYSVMGRMPGPTMDSSQPHLPLDGTAAGLYQDSWMANPAGYAASLQLQMQGPVLGAGNLPPSTLPARSSGASKIDAQVEERLEKRRRQNRESQQRFREKKKRERQAQKLLQERQEVATSADQHKEKMPKAREGDVHEQPPQPLSNSSQQSQDSNST